MGGGTYSSTMHFTRSAKLGYDKAPAREIFKSKSINNAMSPNGVTVRESRDSVEHPESVAIIIALDVTGSMCTVPHWLVRDGLPKIMDKIIAGGIKDPQVLFLAIGDHECDEAPLQVGQFESSDALLDHWLTTVYLEGNGGGNGGESYALAWYFAARHTSIDCMEKRGKKGFLFTIGDEPCLSNYPIDSFKEIMGAGQYSNSSSSSLLSAAREKYDCYHINVKETSSGSRREVIDHWSRLIGEDYLLSAQRKEDIADTIAKVILNNYESVSSGKTDVNIRTELKNEDVTVEENML